MGAFRNCAEPRVTMFVNVGAGRRADWLFGSLVGVGSRVFSAQFFSGADGCRPSKTSEVGLSATTGFVTLAIRFLLGHSAPPLSLMIEEHRGSDKDTNRPSVGGKGRRAASFE